MPDQEEITHQLTLLTTYRRNLAHYLKQQAALGEAYAPPGIVHGIAEARSNIRRIKKVLRDWNVHVEDHPDEGDDSPLLQGNEQPKNSVARVDRTRLRQIFVDYFNEEELRDLVFDMGIDYETLPGTSKAGKARELIAFAERHNRLQDLVEYAQRLRPSVPW